MEAEVPADMAALTKLPGVGRKTANVVLGHALGVPGLPVDRHVLRVANRIGIAESDDPEVVERQLCAAMPTERWTRTSDTLILHGRRICKPKPLCDQCAVRDDCDYFLALEQERDAPATRKGRAAGKKARPARVPRPARGQKGPWRGGAPPLMDRARFERLVADALASIPRRFRDAMTNLVIVVEDEPGRELLREMEIEPPDTLFGLYQGTPLTERRWDYGNALPDRILLFQGPHEREADDEDDLVVSIGETLIHEIGHYFGLSEEEIEEIEEQVLAPTCHLIARGSRRSDSGSISSNGHGSTRFSARSSRRRRRRSSRSVPAAAR